MSVVAMAMPVLPGKEEVWRNFVDQLGSPELREEYSSSRRSAGMKRETVWSQLTPDGRLLAIVMMEADDVDAVLASLARSDDPFARRFRSFLEEVHGVDITSDPLPQVVMLRDTRF